MSVIEKIKSSEYVVLSSVDFMALIAEVRDNTIKKSRKKWLTIREVCEAFGVSRYWLEKSEKEVGNRLLINQGRGKTATKKYHVDSVEKELERQSN